MATFQVETEALRAASAVVARSSAEVGAGESSFGQSAGALEGTPAMGAFGMFVAAVDTALPNLNQATSDLSRALNEAAIAYQMADAAAASRLEVKRR